jgi:acetyltransferase
MDTVAKPQRRAESVYLGYADRMSGDHRIDVPHADRAGDEGEIVGAHDGKPLYLRAIRADDVAALRRGFAVLTAEEVRLRFLHPLTELPEAMARSLCDIDPERAVAFVLADPADTEAPAIHAVARAYIDPATQAAEFALIVHHDYARQGYGTRLLRRLIDACRERGASEIWGDVLSDNAPMLDLCDRLGFARQSIYHDPGIVRVTLAL